jgi:hypothetical protein
LHKKIGLHPALFCLINQFLFKFKQQSSKKEEEMKEKKPLTKYILLFCFLFPRE